MQAKWNMQVFVQLTKKLTMLSYSYYYDFQENDMGRDYGVTAAPQPKHTFFDNKSNKPKHTFWKECSVCFELMKDDAFASFNQYCSHDGTICTNCIKTYVRSAVSGPDVNVKCPECSIFYSSDTVSNLLNAGDREKYHFKLATTMLSSDPNFVWCAHGCGSGQIEENTDSKIKCVNCSKHTCSKHQVPWHRGYSCEAYEFSRSVRDRKTIKYLADNCKRCPSCSWAIERSEGCDHMTCSMCKTSFCWSCFALYEYDEVEHEENCPNYNPREDDYEDEEEFEEDEDMEEYNE